ARSSGQTRRGRARRAHGLPELAEVVEVLRFEPLTGKDDLPARADDGTVALDARGHGPTVAARGLRSRERRVGRNPVEGRLVADRLGVSIPDRFIAFPKGDPRQSVLRARKERNAVPAVRGAARDTAGNGLQE